MNINNYEFNADEHDVWVWSNDCFDIYATPQWEDNHNNLQIEIIHRKDQEQSQIFSIPWSGPKDISDPNYLGLINAITTLLNASQKRTEKRTQSDVSSSSPLANYDNEQTPWIVEVKEKNSFDELSVQQVGPFKNLQETDIWITQAAEKWPTCRFHIYRPTHPNEIN